MTMVIQKYDPGGLIGATSSCNASASNLTRHGVSAMPR
jgi:hypothetical protein